MNTYGFLIPLADEGAAQVESCLGFLRAAHPHAPAVAVSDGVDDPNYADICRRHDVRYVLGSFLKRIECGGDWWKRALELGLALDSAWIVKIDPDTRIHRPFRSEPAHPIAGVVDHAGTIRENVLGGCQAIRRDAARKILGSHLIGSRSLKRHESFGPDEETLKHWRALAYMGSDMSLAWLARNLGIAMGDWGDLGIRFRPPAPAGDFAATHPHKMEPRDCFPAARLNVITTCKGRLAHLKQTLPLWLAEPGVSVTVVDYDCPEGTAAWVRDRYPAVRAIRVKDRPKFNLSAARNVGAAHAPEGWWCFWDADLLCEPGWAAAVRGALRHRRYLLASPIGWQLFGSVVCHSDDFRAAGGYDDWITGWGAEDGDFYSRLRQIGVRPGSFPGHYVRSIEHTDEDRTRHYEVKSKKRSQRLFEVYHTLKVDQMVALGRLPTRQEQAEILVRAHALGGVPVPAWYADGAAGPEPAPEVELMPPVPAPESKVLEPAQVGVARKRRRGTGAPVINVSVVIQNVGQEECSQERPRAEAVVES